ncbi:MAG: DUF1501 domain-containing protein [Saprospiraceae bacterium]
MNRRKFLSSSVVASGTLLFPNFLQGFSSVNDLASRSGKVLVVIQLSGGNDGLNTIIPYENDVYYQMRPTLSIAKKEVLQLGEDAGFHPALASLRKLYDRGEMSIINSVGYPNPDRSHFRSMDIWQSGSSSNEYWQTGWLGRYLDSHCFDKATHHALEVDEGLSLAMKGKHRNGFALSDARRMQHIAKNKFLKTVSEHHSDANHNLSYLYKTLAGTQQSATYLYEQSRVHNSKINYPQNQFAKDLKQIAELITADTATQIYYVSLSGFDTHAGQLNRQRRLLETYASAVKAFTDDLKSNSLFDDTLILTFSEFGRRVAQNASKGTDHGTANNVFLMGGQLRKAGFYNAAPDLLNLKNEDIQYEIDFRRVYATILDRWLGGNPKGILQREFAPLGIV